MSYEELVKSRKCIGDMSKEELFTYCQGLLEEVWDFEKEIERLNNILNKLEKWLDDEINRLKFEDNYDSADTLEIVLEELQELKGSDKE